MKDKVIVKGKDNGNFLITAPHTIYVKRLKEIHLPELHLKKLVKLLEKTISEKYLTSIAWNIVTNNNTKVLDPNYYEKSKLDKSIWYQTLKNIYETRKTKKSLVLLDLHGMKDENNFDIIIGCQALKKYATKRRYRKIMISLMEVLEKFKKKYNLRVGYNIIFKGFINEEYYTISQQANTLGFSAIQMELSKSFRSKLVKEKKILDDFGKTLLNFYKLTQK